MADDLERFPPGNSPLHCRLDVFVVARLVVVGHVVTGHLTRGLGSFNVGPAFLHFTSSEALAQTTEGRCVFCRRACPEQQQSSWPGISATMMPAEVRRDDRNLH